MEILKCTTQQQLEELAQLANEIWHEYFINIITEEQIDYMVEKFQSLDALSKAIHQDNYTYFLAYEQGKLIGYCGVHPEEKRLFLSKLYLHQSARGKHYATQLLNHAIQFAKESNLTAIYLTCNKYNTHSLDVYKSKGFYQIDSVQTDIGHGFIMDDYILQLDL